jgi:hypothetical protein
MLALCVPPCLDDVELITHWCFGLSYLLSFLRMNSPQKTFGNDLPAYAIKGSPFKPALLEWFRGDYVHCLVGAVPW